MKLTNKNSKLIDNQISDEDYITFYEQKSMSIEIKLKKEFKKEIEKLNDKIKNVM